MFKKILLPTVIISVMLAMNMPVYADTVRGVAKRQDITTFQLTKDLNGTKTFERNQVITGRAKNGSVITMTVFWFKADDDKSIISKRRFINRNGDVSGQWIMLEKYSWEVGASEIFAKPVTLNPGKNRIIINVKDNTGVIIKDEVINIEIVHKNELTDFINSIIMKNLRE